MRNAGLDETQAGIKIAGRNINNLRYADDTTLMAESEEDLGNRWGNSGNSDRLYFLVFKITADDDCIYEIKRCLLLGRKVMTNLDSILKSRDISLPTKIHLVKLWFFQ